MKKATFDEILTEMKRDMDHYYNLAAVTVSREDLHMADMLSYYLKRFRKVLGEENDE